MADNSLANSSLRTSPVTGHHHQLFHYLARSQTKCCVGSQNFMFHCLQQSSTIPDVNIKTQHIHTDCWLTFPLPHTQKSHCPSLDFLRLPKLDSATNLPLRGLLPKLHTHKILHIYSPSQCPSSTFFFHFSLKNVTSEGRIEIRIALDLS
jgi:hypothetical protein